MCFLQFFYLQIGLDYRLNTFIISHCHVSCDFLIYKLDLIIGWILAIFMIPNYHVAYDSFLDLNVVWVWILAIIMIWIYLDACDFFWRSMILLGFGFIVRHAISLFKIYSWIYFYRFKKLWRPTICIMTWNFPGTYILMISWYESWVK